MTETEFEKRYREMHAQLNGASKKSSKKRKPLNRKAQKAKAMKIKAFGLCFFFAASAQGVAFMSFGGNDTKVLDAPVVTEVLPTALADFKNTADRSFEYRNIVYDNHFDYNMMHGYDDFSLTPYDVSAVDTYRVAPAP